MGALQVTSASRVSPNVHLALQHVIRSFFRIEGVVSVRLTYADSCTLLHYDNDGAPGFHYYEAESTALNIKDITGPAHSRIIQYLTPAKPQAGFDQDATKF
eukprot:6820455-Pyramimonas_sp.AAC.1